MVNDDEFIELLQDIGLTQYEAQVYLALYKKSPQDAASLSKNSNVPKGKIYTILMELGIKNLVGEVINSGEMVKGKKLKLFELKFFPDSLKEQKNVRIKQLDEEKQRIEKSYSRLQQQLEKIDREIITNVEILTNDVFAVIKGERSLDYHLEKEVSKTKKKLLCNFLPSLLIKYKDKIMVAKKRGVHCEFVLSDIDYKSKKDELEPLLSGSEVHIVPIETMINKNPLIDVFAEARPSMIIFDDKTSIMLFYEQTDDAFLIRNEGMLKYQKIILQFFIQAAKINQLNFIIESDKK
jgi:sugar-specific transcriptional regulator TrmB